MNSINRVCIARCKRLMQTQLSPSDRHRIDVILGHIGFDYRHPLVLHELRGLEIKYRHQQQRVKG